MSHAPLCLLFFFFFLVKSGSHLVMEDIISQCSYILPFTSWSLGSTLDQEKKKKDVMAH